MLKIISLSISVLCLSGCAVYMACPKEGARVQDVQSCRTRQQFVNLGSKILSTERTPDGDTIEIYQIPKERGSAVRAIMHGVLDLSTAGVWELAGTPLEIYLNRNEIITIKVTYDSKDVPIKAEFL
jgi:hypothetical protein